MEYKQGRLNPLAGSQLLAMCDMIRLSQQSGVINGVTWRDYLRKLRDRRTEINSRRRASARPCRSLITGGGMRATDRQTDKRLQTSLPGQQNMTTAACHCSEGSPVPSGQLRVVHSLLQITKYSITGGDDDDDDDAKCGPAARTDFERLETGTT